MLNPYELYEITGVPECEEPPEDEEPLGFDPYEEEDNATDRNG